MGFMKAYKHLDNLCRDMNGVGVTGYIEDMEKKTNGPYYVPGWKDDCLNLKHYRYVRNQIAHENYADEDNMCSDEDEDWIDDFYQRIMIQDDPLALYNKAVTKPRVPKKPAVSERPQQTKYIPNNANVNIPANINKHSPSSAGCATVILIAVAVALVQFFL